MPQNLAAIILAVFTFFASLTVSVNTVNAPEDKSDFIPVVRFSVASDTHIGSAGDGRCTKMTRVLTLAKSDAAKDKNYNSLDAALFVGDLTNKGRKDQFEGFLATANSVLGKETQLMPVLAKSHDGNTLDKQSLSYFSSLSGLETDWHYVINGFHFIGISASTVPGEQYSEYQREWLIQQLDEATADNPDAPVFVCSHEHVSDTVYGSSAVDGWGIGYFRDILCRYPQIIHFSGHSHYPLNDPRSVWQGEFTAVGTGAVYYAELTVDGENKVHPEQYKKIAQCWIVEVNSENTVRLRGFDALSGSLLCEYLIENPADASHRAFTPEKQLNACAAPEFGQDAKIKYSAGKVTVDAAEGENGNPVFLYRAFVYDKNGNEKASALTVNNYWRADSYKTVKISVKASKGDTVKVYAENAYGKCGEPLCTAVK